MRRLKVLELNIESRDYDFLGMAGEIDAYCRKNQIPPRIAGRLQLAFEETVQHLLLPALEEPRIRAVAEYGAETESAEWNIDYGGPRLDVRGTDDRLVQSLLQGVTEEISYAWNEESDLSNQLRITIQKI